MFIHFPDDRMFFFAGLWERWWESKDAEPMETCTVITTTPNGLMSPIHNRMPVILESGDCGKWMDPKTSVDEASAILRSYPDGELEAIPVSGIVNSPANDVPQCVEPRAAAV